MDSCESPLGGIDAFAGLPTKDRRALEPHARVVDLPKGESLFIEGAPRRDVYGLVDGRVKISRLSRSGKELILELVEPGELFGESSLFDDEPHDSFAVAFERSRAVVLPSRVLARLVNERPELPLRLAELVEGRRKKMERRLVTLALQRVRGRVASLLLQLCRDYGVRGGDGIRLRIDLRHQEMASLIGVSREIVSHTLSDFRREGWIASHGRKLVVRDMLPLERIEDVTTDPREAMS